MAAEFDPYYEWLGIPPKDQPPNHYRLLGIEALESDLKLIETAAEQRVTHLRTRQMGKHAELSQRLLNEVSAARAVLLSLEKKAAYDAQLRAALKGKTASAAPNIVAAAPARTPPSAAPGWLVPAAIGGGVLGVIAIGAVIYLLTRGGTPGPVAVQPQLPKVETPASVPPRPPMPPAPPKTEGLRPPLATPAAPPVESPFVPIDPKPEPPVVVPAVTPPSDLPTPPMPVPTPPTRPDVPPPDAVIVRARAELPDEKARIEAEATIRTLLKTDLAAARVPEQKRELARKVLKIVQEEKVGGATHYAGLRLASELAAGSQDLATIEEVCGVLATDYDVDASQLRREALSAPLASPGPAAAKRPLVTAAIGSIEELLAQDDFAPAEAVLAEVIEAARGMKDPELTRTVAELEKSSVEMAAQFRAAEPALAKLKSAPDDPAANALAGRYVAFVKGDFDRGLPMLAKSNDAALAELAKADLAPPAESKAQFALAERWHDYSAAAPAAETTLARERAALWYRAAVEGLTGLEKAKANKRIGELPAPRSGRGFGNPYLVGPEPFGIRVKVLSATYGAGGSRKDVTELVQKHLAKDPFAPVECDDRAMGDPAQGQRKTLQIRVEIEGRAVSLEMPQTTPIPIPSLPDEGAPLVSAGKEFRIVAAKYGAGLTWLDVTHIARQRTLHPGTPIAWNVMWWDDPWHGVKKHYVVWFDYQGRRYVRVFSDGDVKPLLAGSPNPAPPRRFSGQLQNADWEHDKPNPPKLASTQQAFGFVRVMAGGFRGWGEVVRLAVADDNRWQATGKTQQALAMHVSALATPLRDQFEAKVEEFAWSAGKPRVKMIAATEGFCILSGAGGHFGGGGERVWVAIDPKDGYWYLNGYAANGNIGAWAMAFRLKPGAKVKLRYAEFISPGYTAPMIGKDQGFAYLSGMGGNFAGYGEQARVILNDKGVWELIAHNCLARGMAVFVE